MALNPHVVSVNLAEHTLMHLQEVIKNGALVGPRGHKELNPKLRDLVDGIYNVLAGGDVSVQIGTPGVKSQVDTFKSLEIFCFQAINEINDDKAYEVVMEI